MRAVIDLTITKNNYYEAGLEYLDDVIYTQASVLPLWTLTEYFLRRGGILGSPWGTKGSPHDRTSRKAHGRLYGLYLPGVLDRVIVPPIIVDETLTPTTATAMGYQFEKDIDRYEIEKGVLTIFTWLEMYWDLLTDKSLGYRLGMPKSQSDQPESSGLYRPLTTKRAVPHEPQSH